MPSSAVKSTEVPQGTASPGKVAIQSIADTVASQPAPLPASLLYTATVSVLPVLVTDGGNVVPVYLPTNGDEIVEPSCISMKSSSVISKAEKPIWIRA